MVENGKPVEIRFRERGESEAIGIHTTGQRSGLPKLYVQARAADRLPCARESPIPDKRLRVFASLRVRSATTSTVKPEDTAQFRSCCAAQERPKQRVLPTLLLRSLARAATRMSVLSHYGPRSEVLPARTSPIRRYPDLVAHRMHCEGRCSAKKNLRGRRNDVREALNQSTNREQAADSCERDIDKLYIASPCSSLSVRI